MKSRLLNCKKLIFGLKFNNEDKLMLQLKEEIMKFGIEDFDKAWHTIIKVWASKFNERAFLSIKKLGVGLN